jgi:cobalt-zinc-cadmium efflux system membrane fusion protein
MMNISPTAVENGNITSVINLYAPIDGYVTKVNVSNGTYVSPSDIILEIIDTEHIHLELSVFEKDILKVKKAQKINFRIPEASDSIFKAEVHLVGTTIDPVNRRVTVHGHIDDDHTKFVVGMFAEAEIIVSSSQRVALPKEAAIKIDNEYFVLTIDNEKPNEYHLKKIKLNVGLQTEVFVEVLNPDAFKGKKILIKGTYMLLNEGED